MFPSVTQSSAGSRTREVIQVTVGRLQVGRLLPLDCHSTECDGGGPNPANADELAADKAVTGSLGGAIGAGGVEELELVAVAE